MSALLPDQLADLERRHGELVTRVRLYLEHAERVPDSLLDELSRVRSHVGALRWVCGVKSYEVKS